MAYRYTIPLVDGKPKYLFNPQKGEKIYSYVIRSKDVVIVTNKYHVEYRNKDDVKVEKVEV